MFSKHRRYIIRLLWCLALAAIILGAVVAPAVQAQAGTYDFTVSQYGSAAGLPGAFACDYASSGEWGSWVSGTGWVSSTASALGGNANLCFHLSITSTSILGVITSYTTSTTGTLYVCYGNGSCSSFNAVPGVHSVIGVGSDSFHDGTPGGTPFTTNYIGFLFQGNSPSSFIITSVEVVPSTTPTPTLTPTLTITPTVSFSTSTPATTPIPASTCTTPDSNSASFRPGNSWITDGGTFYAINDPPHWLDLEPGGRISMSTNLSDAEYKLTVIYQAVSASGSFTASVGGVPYLISSTDSAEHTFESDPVRYQQGANELSLSKPASDTYAVTVKFFCLTPVASTGAAPALQSGTNGNNDQCTDCDPPISIGDIPGILNWILCNMRRLWTCYFLPILSSVLGFLGTIIKYILSFFSWVVHGIGDILSWIGGIIGSIWAGISGWISNLFAGVNNDFHSSGIADDTNIIASQTRDLPTAITNGIALFGGQLSQLFLEPAANIFDFLIRLIGFAASVIAYILGLIPLVIQALIDGINSSSVPVSGTPICTDPNALAYFPCLGFYILDNTIFAGPAGYLLPVLIAVIVLYNIIWTFTRVKEELSK